jgi:hypothetical protein
VARGSISLTEESPERVGIPRLRCRLPVRLHPDHREIERRGVSWARATLPFASDLQRDAFIDEQHCLWTCLLFPTGAAERVQDICDLTLLLFATDDAFVEHPDGAGAILDAARDVIRGGDGAADGLWGQPLHDVWTRLTRHMPPAQLRRVAGGMDALYRGAAAEVAMRRNDTVPSFEDYMRLRKESVGARIYLVLAEYAIGTDLTRIAGTSRALAALHDVASEHLILANDVFSFHKEDAAGDVINAVSVLRRRAGLSVERSLSRLRREIRLREWVFIRRRDAFLRSVDGRHDEVIRAVEALGFMLSGNVHWSHVTRRYQGTAASLDG